MTRPRTPSHPSLDARPTPEDELERLEARLQEAEARLEATRRELDRAREANAALDESRRRLGEAAEASVRESEERFHEMADALPLMVWVHGPTGEQEMVNRPFSEFFGLAGEGARGAGWRMLLHPDDAERYAREFYDCVRGQRPFHAEARVRNGRGEWRWVESWGHPRYSADGTFRGFVGTSADITDHKRTEAALRESEARFRTLADHIHQLAWMADGEGRIFWYNQRWYAFTGTTLEDVEGWGWTRVHHPDHVDRVVEKIGHCFRTGEVWEDTFPLRGADGSYRWFLSRAVPIRDDHGRVTRWFGTNTDVTEQREAEERLREVDQRKDDFLAMLGHELRNPLAAIRNASEVVKLLRVDDPRLRRAGEVLERQTAQLGTLVDGLLDVSRITRGKFQVDRAAMELAPVLRDVVADLEVEASSRRLQLRSHVDAGPLTVDGDAARLTQVFHNLLANALKFTPEGGTVTLTARPLTDAVEVTIVDTGSGFPTDTAERIFEPFQQGPQDLSRSSGGLGLGLPVARALVELHGGTLSARSEGVGRGAEFVVRLPRSAEAAPGPEKRPSPAQRPLRILVIEDNADLAVTLKDVLEMSGHQVELAAHGRRGVEKAMASRPDLILCDIGLPGEMTGFDVARALRADPRTRETRLVALTGYGLPSDKVRTAEEGFDAHVTKPIDLGALNELLAKAGGNEPAPGPLDPGA